MRGWQQAWGYICMGGIALLMLGASCTARSTSAANPSTVVSPATTAPAFDQGRAWRDLEAQLALGYRVPGTPDHRRTRDWLIARLREATPTVATQRFTHRLGGREVTMWNIIADIPGTGPAPRERILLAAHWDTRPTADLDPDPAKRNTPIAGANDGASGVAVLLEIARQLKAAPITRDVRIVLFDGEDYGPGIDTMLLGSAYYARHLPDPKPAWGVLLDMVGDARLDIYREPYSDQHARAVNDRIFRAARALGYLKSGALPGFVDAPFGAAILDDHVALNEAGVPMVDLIDFHYPAWHTTADTADQCSPTSLGLVGRTVLYAIARD